MMVPGEGAVETTGPANPGAADSPGWELVDARTVTAENR
jgi:hypothetical protein